MIIGLFLAISVAVSLTSLIIIITGSTGILRENMATGAVIGTSQAISYASTTLIISFVVTLALVLALIKKH